MVGLLCQFPSAHTYQIIQYFSNGVLSVKCSCNTAGIQLHQTSDAGKWGVLFAKTVKDSFTFQCLQFPYNVIIKTVQSYADDFSDKNEIAFYRFLFEIQPPYLANLQQSWCAPYAKGSAQSDGRILCEDHVWKKEWEFATAIITIATRPNSL